MNAQVPTTPSAIEGIEAQGLIGQLTTQNVGRVARLTISRALKGITIVVPGFFESGHALGRQPDSPCFVIQVIRKTMEIGQSDTRESRPHGQGSIKNPY